MQNGRGHLTINSTHPMLLALSLIFKALNGRQHDTFKIKTQLNNKEKNRRNINNRDGDSFTDNGRF